MSKQRKAQAGIYWRPLAFISLFLLTISACAPQLYQHRAATTTLVLADGTEIPCRILDVNTDVIYFEATNPADAYRFGEMIAASKVAGIRTANGTLLSIDDYVHAYLPARSREQGVQPQEMETVISRENRGQYTAPEAAQSAAMATPPAVSANQNSEQAPEDQTEDPSLRFRSTFGDTATGMRAASGVGLRVQTPPPTPNLTPPPDYTDLADFVVSSGAAGLVLYRSERFAVDRVRLSATRQQLVEAIQASEMWRQRKDGLRNAHRAVAEAFAAKYDNLRSDVQSNLGFRAGNTGDPLIQFLLFLHENGNLRSRRQVNLLNGWFGEAATQAMVDILANFDDWYYIVVLAAQKLESP